MNPEAGTSRYFTLTDDKSNKFWQITIADTSYTVSYGRIGTTGQSQQKNYDTANQCCVEADKIIREKIAKGYTEQGNAVAAGSVPAAQKRSSGAKAETHDKEAQEATLHRYQQLIDSKRQERLLPFLQSVNRAHYPALRKAIKAARKHYCEARMEVVEGSGGNQWRSVHNGTEAQCRIIDLSGMALLPAPELKSFFLMRYLNNLEQNELVEQVLDWARPSWLTDFLNAESRSNGWGTVEYRMLRRWEEKGYVQYLPELFVRSMARCREFNTRNKAGAVQRYTDYICNDKAAYTRDLPLLFEYETEMHGADYSYDAAAKTTVTLPSIWYGIFGRLLKEDKLDRQWMLESCITVQSKDWNASLRSFFRKQVDEMQPTLDELLAIQPLLFQLLGAQHPHVVSWAVGWIRGLAASPRFDKAALLEWAPAVMMRSDCKTAVKALLSLLEKAMKKGASGNGEVLSVAADVFAQPDLGLQTKAAGLVRKYGSTGDDALRDKLQLYSDQMLGTIRQEVQDFINTAEDTPVSAISTKQVTYTYNPAPLPLLADLQEVSLPQTGNDWLFAVGRYIGSEDVLDMEVLINACILPPEDALADGEQLLPYIKQLSAAAGGYIRTFTNNWLLQMLQNPAQPFEQQAHQGDYETLRLHVARLQHAQRKMQARSALPLLSFPSHAPHYISPLVLVQRLVRYQQAGEQIDILDLSIALARTIADGAGEAAQLANQLEEPLKGLIVYALTGEGDPAPKKEGGGLLHAIAKGLGLGREKDSAHLEMAYITAARTRRPDATFDSLTKSQFAERPNVVQPFVPAWHLKESWNEYVDWRTKKKTRTPSWRELLVDLPQKKHAGSPLLYSNDLAAKDKTFYWWDGLLSGNYDVSWWYSIVPQAPESLFALLLKSGCRLSDVTAAATAGLRLMLGKHFRFRQMSGLLLACGLVAAKREDRGLAAEVLIQHMGTQTINPVAVGRHTGALLREGYAPVQRLAETLQLIKDVSPLHNRALAMLTEEVILSFGLLTEPPKNTKKLLEVYLDVLVKTSGKPEAEALSLLQRWTSGSLKPIIHSLNQLGASGTNQ